MKHLGSISPTFYAQLLPTQIPKVQKNTVKLSVFFVFLGSLCVKASHQMLMKSTLRRQLITSQEFLQRDPLLLNQLDVHKQFDLKINFINGQHFQDI